MEAAGNQCPEEEAEVAGAPLPGAFLRQVSSLSLPLWAWETQVWASRKQLDRKSLGSY